MPPYRPWRLALIAFLVIAAAGLLSAGPAAAGEAEFAVAVVLDQAGDLDSGKMPLRLRLSVDLRCRRDVCGRAEFDASAAVFVVTLRVSPLPDTG